MTDPIIETPKPQIPPLMHIFKTTVYHDNRGFEVHHRETTFGAEPRGFVHFVGRVVHPFPTPDVNTPGGYREQPTQIQAAMDVKSVQEAFEKFFEIMGPATDKAFEKHKRQFGMDATPKIAIARQMPRGPHGG